MDNFLIGTIAEITENGVKLLIDGEDAATTKEYQYLSSYKPAVNDRVLIICTSDTYIVAGKFEKSDVPGPDPTPTESGTFESGYGHWEKIGNVVTVYFNRPISLGNGQSRTMSTGSPAPIREIRTVCHYGNSSDTSIAHVVPALFTTSSQLKIYNNSGESFATTSNAKVGFVYLTN